MTTGRSRITLVAVAVIGVAAACGTTDGAAKAPPTAPPGGAVVVASGMAFDRTEVSVPAAQAFQLVFENRDTAPHNVRLLNVMGQTVFVGEIFGGSSSLTYQVPALPAGTYPFRCDVHPDMVGTLIATVAGPEPAAAPAPVHPAPNPPVLSVRSDPQ